MTTSTRTTRTNTTTTLLDQQQDQITKVRNTQARLRKGRKQIDKLAKDLQTLLNDGNLAQVGCWTDAYYDRTEVVMYADIRGEWIDSLRHPTLLALFAKIEDEIGAFDQTQDHTWVTDPARSYTINNIQINDTLSVRIKITVYVAGDSPTCRKVQVGTKIESVPVYEIQCA